METKTTETIVMDENVENDSKYEFEWTHGFIPDALDLICWGYLEWYYADGSPLYKGRRCEGYPGEEIRYHDRYVGPTPFVPPPNFIVEDGKFKCPGCGEWYWIGTTCPKCLWKCDLFEVTKPRGIETGKYYSYKEAPSGLDPIDYLPIVENDVGFVMAPDNYREMDAQHREWEHRLASWWGEDTDEPLTYRDQYIFPEPEPKPIDFPLCCRCKCPERSGKRRGPLLRGRFLFHGLCIECWNVIVLDETEIERMKKEILEVYGLELELMDEVGIMNEYNGAVRHILEALDLLTCEWQDIVRRFPYGF